MQEVTIDDAAARLAALIRDAEGGQDVVITDGGRVVARLVPVAPRKRIPGLRLGAARIASDFDAPLPDDFWAGSK